MSDRYPQIRCDWVDREDRFPCARTSLNISFYMRRPHAEIVPAVMSALDRYRQAIGPDTLAWTPDGEGYWEELNAASWDRTRSKLLHPRGANICLRETDRLVTDYEFTYFGTDVNDPAERRNPERTCAVAFWFPTEYLEKQGPEHMRKLALALGAELPFNSGHAGLSVYFSEDLYQIPKLLWPQCFRHPGLDMPAMDLLPSQLGTRIKGVSWLTFLGEPASGSAGRSGGPVRTPALPGDDRGRPGRRPCGGDTRRVARSRRPGAGEHPACVPRAGPGAGALALSVTSRSCVEAPGRSAVPVGAPLSGVSLALGKLASQRSHSPRVVA